MSTSRNKASGRPAGKSAVAYLGVAAFCLVFAQIYYRFSHGVHSPYMTWLFAWPLVLGALPSGLFRLFKKLPLPGKVCYNAYNSGVAAVTVSSLLGGIFEIAGNASDYQEWLMYTGAAMLAGGAAVYLYGILKKRPNYNARRNGR